ncbi:hypothetical protein [Yersinia wautersii]|uniref:hypothetical protein n=1 Tax=Yersinia wautersii TaxID=1341643 RepID=UPI000417A15F|nr:hypothetical protein [Yersinia wautersii]
MFDFRKKHRSLSQLKEKEQDLNKEIEMLEIFISKMLMVSMAFVVAYLASDVFWTKMFDGLTQSLTNDPANTSENALFVVNMVMYIMPLSFGFMALGLLTSSFFGWFILLMNKVFLRRITKVIEVCSVQGETQHEE